MTEHKLAYGRAQLDRTKLADSDAAGSPLDFVASTTGMNRYGYSLRNDGWLLDNFNANPVVLWMHNPFQPPIGTGQARLEDGNVILGNVRFDTEDELALAIDSKYRRGFLNAVSVGFDFVKENGTPADWWSASVEEMRDELFYDLAEVSAVTVPADPGALRTQSRLALHKLGHELLDMFDDGQRAESTITIDQIRAAVRAELDARGIAAPGINTPPEVPADGISQDAAQGLLAVFATEGINA